MTEPIVLQPRKNTSLRRTAYPDDVAHLRRVLSWAGYVASDADIEDAWSEYSDSMFAGWMHLYEEDGTNLALLLQYLEPSPSTSPQPESSAASDSAKGIGGGSPVLYREGEGFAGDPVDFYPTPPQPTSSGDSSDEGTNHG